MVNPAAAVTAITDTIQDTTVSLSATTSITEAGTSITYTATLTNPADVGSPVTVHLSNGETITIAGGASSNSVVHAVTPNEDVYLDPTTVSATISSATGGNFENLVVNPAAAVTAITDTINTVTATLTTSTSSIAETGGSITYTVTLANVDGLPVNPKGDLTFSLANGETVTIHSNQTSNSVTVPYTDAQITTQANIGNSISSVSSGGALYEDLVLQGVTSVDVNYGVVITGIGSVGGDLIVHESNLPAGSSPDGTTLKQSGAFSISALDGISSVTVGGTTLSYADLHNLSSTHVSVASAAYGALVLTGYTGDVTGGTVTFSYTLDTTVNNGTQPGATDSGYLESLQVQVNDVDTSTAISHLNINIVDDVPTMNGIQSAVFDNQAGLAITGHILATPGADGIASYQFDPTNITPAANLTYTYSNNNTTLVATDGTGQTDFTVNLHADGTYEFFLAKAAPESIVYTPPFNTLNLPNHTDSFPVDLYKSYDASGNGIGVPVGTVTFSDANADTQDLAISQDGLGINNNLMNSGQGEVMKMSFDTPATDVVLHIGNFSTGDTLNWKVYGENPTNPLDHNYLLDSGTISQYFYDSNGVKVNLVSSESPNYLIDLKTNGLDPNIQFDSLTIEAGNNSFKFTGFSVEKAVTVGDQHYSFNVVGVDSDGDKTATASGSFGVLVAGSGHDLVGTAGSEVFNGGAGNDLLISNGGADTFVWHLADAGTPIVPAVDVVQGFQAGDVLKIADLLTDPAAAASLTSQFDSTTGNTTIHFSDTTHDQTIVLQGYGDSGTADQIKTALKTGGEYHG